MKKIIKHLRIAIAEIFLQIGHKIDCRDIEDLRAEMRRLDPTYEKSSEPLAMLKSYSNIN